MTAPTDYDAPRSTITADDILHDLPPRRAGPYPATIDAEQDDPGAAHELPPIDLLDDELTIIVVAVQADEFRCSRCFLVRHKSQQAATTPAQCRDCS